MESKQAKKRPLLDQVLLYENENVIKGFIKNFKMSYSDASEIFNQLKKMLWLINEMECDGLKSENKIFSIDSSLLVIDEMWHTFILFTRDYRKFCFDYFGYFIDHVPTVDSDPKQISRLNELRSLSSEARVAKMMDEKRWQYTYVFQKLGKSCFLMWYNIFHQKYTMQYLAELRTQAMQDRVVNISTQNF